MSKAAQITYQMEVREIDTIYPNQDNPRYIKEPKFKRLVKSIKDAPWMLKLRPIVVNEAGMVLGGNMRYQACKAAGLKTIAVVVATGLTVEQEREFIIKDNVGFGEWDWDQLANHWDSTQLIEWGLDVWKAPEPEPLPAQPDNQGLKKIELYYSQEDYREVTEKLKTIKQESGTASTGEGILWLIKNWGG